MDKQSFELFIQSQIPIAWEAGVRFEHFEKDKAQTSVVFSRMNQNPFGSMFWAVEGMAAEFAGGMLLLSRIAASGKDLASLVIRNEGRFMKKALGKIVFSCNDADRIDQAINTALNSGEAVEVDLRSSAMDEANETVAEFTFTWSIKLRQ